MKMKNNIAGQFQENDNLPSWLESARHETNGLKVPVGYFDVLGPGIIDRIKEQENKALSKSHVPAFRKPFVWAPVLAIAIVAVLFIFIIPAKKTIPPTTTDEWIELNMAYDDSYAEEALLAESYTIENELELSEIDISKPASATDVSELTDEEITEYLINQDIDPDFITENQ